jgi:hypothetical protein
MENVSRATQSLLDIHGKNAARVAAQRALNAALGGSGESAQIWRQIAADIRELHDGARLAN